MSKIQLKLSVSQDVQGRCYGHMSRKLLLTRKNWKRRTAPSEVSTVPIEVKSVNSQSIWPTVYCFAYQNEIIMKMATKKISVYKIRQLEYLSIR